MTGLLDFDGRRRRGFTLIELMAVVAVIVLLVAITLGISSYAQKQAAIAMTKSQIASIEAALESYKSDWGYYPATSPERVSNRSNKESTNNVLLYNALSPTNAGRKVYMKFSTAQIRTNSATALPNIYDPWGTPLNYYCSPLTAFGVSNNLPSPITGTNTGYSVGGQVNISSFDLFSYGPDRVTYVPGALHANGNFSGWYLSAWTTKSAADDDITNW